MLATGPETDATVLRCEYCKTLELPAFVIPALKRIIVNSILVSGLVLPSPMADQLADVLNSRDQLGPVIAHPGSARSTVLAGPSDGPEPDATCVPEPDATAEALSLLNAAVVIGEIVLPSPADELRGYRRWSVVPRTNFLPSLREVIAAALEVARDRAPHM